MSAIRNRTRQHFCLTCGATSVELIARRAGFDIIKPTRLTKGEGDMSHCAAVLADGAVRGLSTFGCQSDAAWIDRYSMRLSWGPTFCSLLLAFASVCDGWASEYFVDGTSGNNSFAGTSRASAWKTISRAFDTGNYSVTAKSGDAVTVLRGVYNEQIRITAASLAGAAVDKKLILRADPNTRGRNQVVITRPGGTVALNSTWTPDGNVYWVPLPGNFGDRPPARVLGNHADAPTTAPALDFYQYGTLAGLKSRQVTNFYLNSSLYAKTSAGPDKGFYVDSVTKRFYVRLSARYPYATDPSKWMFFLAPAKIPISLSDVDGKNISATSSIDFCLGIMAPTAGQLDAHVVIDGFTFRLSALAGVYTQANDVEVANCYFFGCRTAIVGSASSDGPNTSRVKVTRCEFTQYPLFTDTIDVLLDYPTGVWSGIPLPRYFWWYGKPGLRSDLGYYGSHSYELGMATEIGADWVFDGNYIHDCFEGLSARGVQRSTNLKISNNVFERILDNGLESEGNNQGLLINDNFFIDNYEPFSWQHHKLAAAPGEYAEQIRVAGNVFYDTVGGSNAWRSIATLTPTTLRAFRGIFKIHPPEDASGVISLTSPGLFIHNNTVFVTVGDLLDIAFFGDVEVRYIYFISNILSAERVNQFNLPLIDNEPTRDRHGIIKWDGNGVYLSAGSSVASTLRGTRGFVANSPDDFQLRIDLNSFAPRPGTAPVLPKNVLRFSEFVSLHSGTLGSATDTIPLENQIGAFPSDGASSPVIGKSPRVGPYQYYEFVP
jgi:hypothetical protein